MLNIALSLTDFLLRITFFSNSIIFKSIAGLDFCKIALEKG